MTTFQPKKTAHVIDIFSGKTLAPGKDGHILRVSPESDGLGMLYANEANPDKLFSMKIIGWGIQANGNVVGLVPWLNDVTACTDLDDPLNGHWEGYYNFSTGQIFEQPPLHKKVELAAAIEYFKAHNQSAYPRRKRIIQEIPDIIGTHAVFLDFSSNNLVLIPVFSWRLLEDGSINGLIVDKTRISKTPVLTGDHCLCPCQDDPRFKYYFQYSIANKIKNHDPVSLAEISDLLDI